MLRKHNGFTDAPLYKRIQSEVAAFLQRNATSPTPTNPSNPNSTP